MEYNKSQGGDWLDTNKVTTGSKVKIVSECTKQESRFKDKEGNSKIENQTKVKVQGQDGVFNMRLNWTTVYGLIDAFGKESKEWVEKVTTVKTLDAMVGDTMRTIIYLIPEGFELRKNAESKMEIAKVGTSDGIDVSPDDGVEIPF